MKKLLLLICVLLCLVTLFGCGEEVSVPQDMQLVSGGADKGYYFFAPEEWTVSNIGEIDAVYVSRVDTSSVTLIEIKPESFVKADPSKDDVSYFFEDYFNDSKAEFPSDTQYLNSGEEVLIGSGETKADKALKYTYTYTYSEHKFSFMQILIHNNGRFYIFTYSAPAEEKTEGVTNYDFYLEKVQKILDSFIFMDVETAQKVQPEYATDSDGYLLISDEKLCGYSLFVHPTFSPDFSSAITSATHSDGSNITMTKTTTGGLPIGDYFELRKKELSAFVSDFNLLNTNVKAEFSNADNAAAYEYTYSYNGESFHVNQYFAVVGRNGYVFTYTAKSDNYSLHLSEIEQIIEKVSFK